MKRLNCFTFVIPKRRFVYKDPSKVEVVPAVLPAEKEKKTLFETLEEAREVLKAAEDRLKKVEQYYGITAERAGKTVQIITAARKMPDALRKAYIDFHQRYLGLRELVIQRSRLGGEWEGKGPEKRKVRSEEDVIEATLAGIDEVFGTFRAEHEKTETEKEKRHAGDPMYSDIGQEKLTFPETTLRPPEKKKEQKKAPSQGPAPEEGEEREPNRTQNPRGWEMYQLRRVIDKILRVNRQPVNDKELMVLRFFLGKGKSADFWYIGKKVKKKYVLERDLSGDFVRILGAAQKAPEEGEGETMKEVTNPYMALKVDAVEPRWKSEGAIEDVNKAIAENKKSVNKQIDWLLSAKAPAGSRVTVESSESMAIYGEAGSTLRKALIEVAKGADGTLRLEVKEQTFSGEGTEMKESKPARVVQRFFGKNEYAAAREFITGYVRPKLETRKVEGTPEDAEREKEIAEERQRKELYRVAHSLALDYIAVRILGPAHKDAFQKDLDRLMALIGALELTRWVYKDEAVPFRMRVKGGELAILEDNPEYEKGSKKQPKYVVASHYAIPEAKPEGASKAA